MSFKNAVFTTKQNGAAEILDEIYVMQHPKDFSVVQKIDDLLFDEDKLSKIKERNIQQVQSFSIEKNSLSLYSGMQPQKKFLIKPRVKELHLWITGFLIMDRRIKHNLCLHPLYGKWMNMKNRCNNKKDPRYKYYGARGIYVCSRS